MTVVVVVVGSGMKSEGREKKNNGRDQVRLTHPMTRVSFFLLRVSCELVGERERKREREERTNHRKGRYQGKSTGWRDRREEGGRCEGRLFGRISWWGERER